MEEGAGSCFTLIVFLLSCGSKYYVALRRGTWLGLQRAIVVFLDHTYSQAYPGSEFVVANTLAKWKKLGPNEIDLGQARK